MPKKAAKKRVKKPSESATKIKNAFTYKNEYVCLYGGQIKFDYYNDSLPDPKSKFQNKVFVYDMEKLVIMCGELITGEKTYPLFVEFSIDNLVIAAREKPNGPDIELVGIVRCFMVKTLILSLLAKQNARKYISNSRFTDADFAKMQAIVFDKSLSCAPSIMLSCHTHTAMRITTNMLLDNCECRTFKNYFELKAFFRGDFFTIIAVIILAKLLSR